MIKKLCFLFFLGSVLFQVQAQTTIPIYDNVLFYDGYAGMVSNPSPSGMIRLRNDLFTTKLTPSQLSLINNSLELDVYIKAACDNYDRIGNVNLVLVPKGDASYDTKTALKIEMGRFITPFMNKNKTPNTVPYVFMVDNIAKILKDSVLNASYDFWVELEVFGVPYAAQTQVTGCSGRNDVFFGSLNFITDDTETTVPNNTFVLPLNFKKDLNNYKEGASDAIGETIRTIHYSLPQVINNTNYYLITSNHGANTGGEEYNRRWHYIYHDDSQLLSYKPGETSCEPYRVYNTQPNGIYGTSPRTDAQWQSFSNWCPGAIIPIRPINLGNQTAGDHTFKISVPTAVFQDAQGNIPVSVYVQGENTVLGIHDFKSYSYDIYPNPTSEFINIDSTDIINSYQIYDAQGRLLTANNHGDTHLRLNISAYSKGIYFLEMNFDKGKASEKIIKE